jgi:flagellar protein FlaG
VPIESSNILPPGTLATQHRHDPASAGRVADVSGASARAPGTAGEPGPRARAPASPDPRELAEAAAKINRRLEDSGASIEFAVDPATRRVVARIVDKQTREVIRQIPSETSLTVAAVLDKLMPGVLLQEQA